jgi:hypothetical protein
MTQGHNATYGICFRDKEVWLSGRHLTADERAQIQEICLCAKTIGDPVQGCQKLVGDLPTLSRRTNTSSTNTWNFADQVLSYWPQNYIKSNMWDLTHYDYDDNFYDKAYRYHMDNNLPHLGHWIVKPENIIAFPLFKGLGYRMTYSPTHGHVRFPGKTGWWSDNLQNRDHTLVSGQASSNDISVGKASLVATADWIDISDLQVDQSIITGALKNVYTCRFNRKIPKVRTANTRGFHLKNVYQNNVVPVPPDFTPAWESGYACDSTSYTPENIGKFPNIVYTDTPRDWLYFAANLRGNALENINVLYQLSPIASTSIRFEGLAKVQDGGRFT